MIMTERGNRIVHSYYKFISNIWKSNFTTLPSPYKLTFAVTYHCNHKCKLCNIWKKPLKEELDIEDFERFFENCNKFNWIHLTGGEIFLRDDLLKIIKIIFERSKDLYLFQFPTNGYLTEKIVSTVQEVLRLSSKPPKIMVGVSIDGPKKVHDKLRGTKNAWKKAMDTFIELRKMGQVQTYIGMTLSSLNHQLIDETYLSIKERYPKFTYESFNINIVHQSKHYFNNMQNKNTNFSKKETHELADTIRKMCKRKIFSFTPTQYLRKKYLENVIKKLTSEPIPFKCQALSVSCFIDPYGDIYPCTLWEKKVGNIKTFNYSLKKVWNDKDIVCVRKIIKTKGCTNCWTACEAYPGMLGKLSKLII